MKEAFIALTVVIFNQILRPRFDCNTLVCPYMPNFSPILGFAMLFLISMYGRKQESGMAGKPEIMAYGYLTYQKLQMHLRGAWMLRALCSDASLPVHTFR